MRNESKSLSRYDRRFHIPQPTPRLDRRWSDLRRRRDRLRHGPLRCTVGDIGDCGCGCRDKCRSGDSPNGILRRGPTSDWCEPSPVARRRLTGPGCLALGDLARSTLWSEYLRGDGLACVKIVRGPPFLPDCYRFRLLLGLKRWGRRRFYLGTDLRFRCFRTA